MPHSLVDHPISALERTSTSLAQGGHSRIVSVDLPEDQQCERPSRSGYCFCAVRTGGDVLEGQVAFWPSPVGDTVIDVCFEGFSRTWIQNKVTGQTLVNETRFLQQVDTIRSQPTIESSPLLCISETRTASFKFRIAERLPITSDAPESDPRFQELCPSITSGALHEQSIAGKAYMQPMIVYRLSATVRAKRREPQGARVGIARPITITPTTTARPPIYTDAFGGEYVIREKSKVRRHFYSHSIGFLELSAEEPPPINILEHHPRMSTVIILRASFQPNRKISTHAIEPYNWAFKVRTRLRRRIFYATKRFDKEPTLEDAQRKSHIGLRTQMMQSEEREYAELPWRINHVSPHGTILPTAKCASPWTVVIPVMFTTGKNLIPSFLSETAGLRYSIDLEVGVVGMWASSGRLEVPLQIIRDRPSQHDESVEDACSEEFERPPDYRGCAY